LVALDDRPRPGKEPTITPEAKAWLVPLACDKAKEHGYPHDLWTTRLLARHARENAPAAGHECLADLVQGTVCKILGQEEIKPHKVRYYLERRDAKFEQKMAELLCVYRQVQVLKKAVKSKKPDKSVVIVSYDEKKLGIQAIATHAPDSVRRVEDITEALWGTRVSPSTVSNLNKRIYATIEAWRMRPIEGEHPYLYLDGIVLKRSWAGEVRNVSLLVATSVNGEGYREILGIGEGGKEDGASWLAFLKQLKQRGLAGVRLIVSDACLGLVEAAGEVFPQAAWQRCVVH
jgi:hypothetical protein